eukprot:877647-Prorocentrum_minimum.AAC.2
MWVYWPSRDGHVSVRVNTRGRMRSRESRGSTTLGKGLVPVSSPRSFQLSAADEWGGGKWRCVVLGGYVIASLPWQAVWRRL